jgi:hypothetical protein
MLCACKASAGVYEKAQKPIGSGLYVMTDCSTDKKQQNIEYNSSWHNNYLKWICGFANAQGGRIYVSKRKFNIQLP